MTQIMDARSNAVCSTMLPVSVGRCESTLREQLSGFSMDLHALGFAPGTSGNLSARLDRSRVLATPTGCSKRVIGPGDLTIVDMEGRHLQGDRHVTSEIGMHLTIYRERPDVEAVVQRNPQVVIVDEQLFDAGVEGIGVGQVQEQDDSGGQQDHHDGRDTKAHHAVARAQAVSSGGRNLRHSLSFHSDLRGRNWTES